MKGARIIDNYQNLQYSLLTRDHVLLTTTQVNMSVLNII